jgi:hypothetical protein
MTARIYKPAKTAMQSGRAKTLDWMLDFDLKDAQQRDPLMGWAGSRDTARQLALRFQTREEAVAYAKKHGIDYVLTMPQTAQLKIKAYADNFKYDRVR